MQRGTELEEQLCSCGRKGYIPQFIQNDQLMAERVRQELGKPLLLLSEMKFIDQSRNAIKAHAPPLPAGSEAQGGGQMGFNAAIDLPP